MKTKTTVLLTILGVFAIVGTGFAYGGKHYTSEKHMNRMVERVAKKLSLDDSQKDKLSIAKEAALSLRQSMHNDRETLQNDILSLVSGDTFDQELVLKHINAKTEAVRDNSPMLVAAVADFYNSLNAEQQAQVRKRVEKKIDHIRDHHDD